MLRSGRWTLLTVLLACTSGGGTTTGTEDGTGGSSSTAPGSSSAPTTGVAEGSSGGSTTPAGETSSGPGESSSEATSASPTETGEAPACPQAGRFNTERFTDDQIAVVDDLVFSSEGRTMDLYVPDAALEPCPDRPVLLMLHGGGWIVGQKEWMAARARWHARRGIVVATVDYRKTDQAALCSGDGWNRAAYRAMQDVNAAVQLLVADAGTYAIDPGAIFFYGNSAGAITTLSLALTDEAGVAAAFPELVMSEGPLDGQSMHPGTAYAIRAMYTQAGALLDDALLAAAPHPALLLLHSEGDESVPYAVGGSAVCPGAPITVYGSSWVGNAVDERGGCVALVQVEGAVHDLDEVYGERCDAVDPACDPSRMDETADRFFSAVLAGTCGSQHTFCTASDCQLVDGQPPEWFMLFP